jgi:hypothetical protein
MVNIAAEFRSSLISSNTCWYWPCISNDHAMDGKTFTGSKPASSASRSSFAC